MHPHCGEAGAIGAAFETLRVVKRRGYSTFIGIDSAIDIEYTSTNDETTRCHFCPNLCARTFIDTMTPAGDTARYISGFSCEKGTVESEDAMLALSAERKKLMKQYPNLVDTESKLLFRHFYDQAPMPDDGSKKMDVEVKRHLDGVRRVQVERPFQRSSAEAWKKRAPHPHRHPQGAQHLVDGAVLADVLRDARASRSSTWCSPTTPRRRCGSRAASTGRSIPATRRRSGRPTSTTCCSTTTPTSGRSTSSSSRR